MYLENLPESCPPVASSDVALKLVCRFMMFPKDDARNFHSHAKLGKPTGNASPCQARSVSLFRAKSIPSVLAAKKTAFFKNRPIAVLDIPEGHGTSDEKTSGHIDCWFYKKADPHDFVISVCNDVEALQQVVGDL